MLFHMNAKYIFVIRGFQSPSLAYFLEQSFYFIHATASNDLQFDFPTWYSQHKSITYLNMELCNGMLSLIDRNPNTRTCKRTMGPIG